MQGHLQTQWWLSLGLEGLKQIFPDSKVHGANMGTIWGRQGPGGPHIGPMDFAIWVLNAYEITLLAELKVVILTAWKVLQNDDVLGSEEG